MSCLFGVLMIANIYWMLMCQALSVSVSVQSLSLVRLFATCEPQHTRPPCASPTPRVHPNPCPWSRWCHPTISSSVIPFSSALHYLLEFAKIYSVSQWCYPTIPSSAAHFSSCPQSCPASGSFPMSRLFASGDQRVGTSALATDLSMINQS